MLFIWFPLCRHSRTTLFLDPPRHASKWKAQMKFSAQNWGKQSLFIISMFCELYPRAVRFMSSLLAPDFSTAHSSHHQNKGKVIWFLDMCQDGTCDRKLICCLIAYKSKFKKMRKCDVLEVHQSVPQLRSHVQSMRLETKASLAVNLSRF